MPVLPSGVFAADLPAATTRLLSVTQQPFSAQCFGDLTQGAGWHTVPSWGLVATQDLAIPPALQRFEYQRARARKTVSVAASHCAMVSHPRLVTELILDAFRDSLTHRSIWSLNPFVTTGTSGPFVPRYVMRFAALAGIRPDQFAGVASRPAFGNDRVRIPTADLYRVWEITAHALRGKVSPIAAAEQLEPGGLHVLDYLYLTADTLTDAFRVTLPHAHLVVDPADPFESVRDELGVTARWRWNTHDQTWCVRELQEQTLGQMLRMARLSTGRPVVPARVQFTVPAPADHTYLVESFGTRDIVFGAESISMTFSHVDADSPLPRADPALAAILADYADSVSATAQPVANWLEHFRVELASLCANEVPEIAQLAQRLVLSTRTLQRRLLDAGTTWRAEVDLARHESTHRMLRTTSLSIEAIAQRVGYSDERALRRAVHRWYGMSPNQVRLAHRESDGA